MTAQMNATNMVPQARQGGLVLATTSLWRREMVRFFRQRGRVIGALVTPLVFWLLLGSGLNRSFASPGSESGYLEYFYPGMIVMMLLFTAIFSTISVIEDRREGFMQGVLVAPIPRLAIVLGKVLGGACIATAQGVMLLALWPIVGTWPGVTAMAAAVGVMFVLSIALTALGLCVAWPCDSTASFHGIMNLFLMPMWFLCGAVFPITRAPGWMQAVMYANPLTYGQSAFTAALRGGEHAAAPAQLTVMPLLGITIVWAVVMVFFAAHVVSKPRKDGLA